MALKVGIPVPQCTAPKDGHQGNTAARAACPVCGVRRRGGAPLGEPRPPQVPSIHRAANRDFDPEQYQVVILLDSKLQRAELRKLEDSLEWADDVPYGQVCSHCGKKLRYLAVLRHESGQHVTVGETCLDERFSLTKAQFASLRKSGREGAATLVRKLADYTPEEREKAIVDGDLEWLRPEVERASAARQEMWDSSPSQLACLTYPEMAISTATAGLARSLSRQLRDQVWSLTSAQARYFLDMHASDLHDLARQEQTAAFRRAREEAEAEAKAKRLAPDGPQVAIQGTVINTKWIDNPFSPNPTKVHKMTVALPNGALVYATVPARFRDQIDKGTKISFTADAKRKDNDSGSDFAYASRLRDVRVEAPDMNRERAELINEEFDDQ